MKKEIYIHLGFLVSYLLLISILNGWFKLNYWVLWLGGVVGTILPDIDHVIYVYFLKPHELTSQRARYMVSKREFLKIVELLFDTRNERSHLIFHSALFQVIFAVVTFLIITSSGSVFGIGLVLAFSLHLLVDQLIDRLDTGNLDTWFNNLSFSVNEKIKKAYFGFVVFLFLFFTFLV